ncbi:hypothetical protein ACOME3_005954 [Neoechinorhynchus agilis]
MNSSTGSTSEDFLLKSFFFFLQLVRHELFSLTLKRSSTHAKLTTDCPILKVLRSSFCIYCSFHSNELVGNVVFFKKKIACSFVQSKLIFEGGNFYSAPMCCLFPRLIIFHWAHNPPIWFSETHKITPERLQILRYLPKRRLSSASSPFNEIFRPF